MFQSVYSHRKIESTAVINSKVFCIRTFKKLSGPKQALTLGKYSLRQTTTHDMLHCVLICLTETWTTQSASHCYGLQSHP